jgi:hypothetical protein
VELKFDRGLCERCGTYDCLTKCQYLRLDREGARREMAKNVIAVLEAASVSFGVLGNEEECDGNEAYMLGARALPRAGLSKHEEVRGAGGQEGTDGPSCLQLDEEVPGEEL